MQSSGTDACGGAHHHLTTVCRRSDPSRPVDLEPDGAGRRALKRAGMYPHPNPDLGIRPRIFAEFQLGIPRCPECLPASRERGKESVAFRALDEAVVRADGAPEYVVMRSEHLRPAVT